MSDDTITDLTQSAFERAHHVYEAIGAVREQVDALVQEVQRSLEGQSSPQQLDLFKNVLAVQAVYAHITTGAWDAMQTLDGLREEQPS